MSTALSVSPAALLSRLNDLEAENDRLTTELTPLRELAPFLAALERGRKLHPEGADYEALLEEIDELGVEMARLAIVSEPDPRDPPCAGPDDPRILQCEAVQQRIRAEALDCAIVAFRISIGETK